MLTYKDPGTHLPVILCWYYSRKVPRGPKYASLEIEELPKYG